MHLITKADQRQGRGKGMKTITCKQDQLFDWLDKHLDDCPCDWYAENVSRFDERTIIVFETGNKDS